MRQDAANQREASLSGKTYSRSDERRILHVLGRGLLKDFPNPERIGCPETDVLKKIASHEMPLAEADKWLDHLGSCSPCYADFKRFAEAHEWRRKRTWFAAAAGIILVLAVAGWALFHSRNENLTAQTAILDLRDRSIARGEEPNPAEPALEISRRVSHLKVYLPVGSGEGDYEIQISGRDRKMLFAAKGTAMKQRGVVYLAVETDLSSTSPGLYVLQIRKLGSARTSYPLRVK